MKLMALQTQLMAALGACLAVMILVGPASAGIENQRQLELAGEEQQFQVVPYLSHGILTASDAAGLAGQRHTPDGYQPQLGTSDPVAANSPVSLRDRPDGYQPHLGTSDSVAANSPVSLRDRPDGYQPHLGVSDLGVVAEEGFDWTTTGFAASIIAAMLLVATATFTYGNRRGYRSA